jgi:hypothetical protein
LIGCVSVGVRGRPSRRHSAIGVWNVASKGGTNR